MENDDLVDCLHLFELFLEFVEVGLKHLKEHVVEVVLAELKHLVSGSVRL